MRPRPSPPTVYPIADHDALGGDSEGAVEAVAGLAAAGAGWIQVRAKGLGDRDLHGFAAAACRAVREANALIWVNDRPDLAALLPVAGVHLGQHDLPPAAARRVVGADVWIGMSTHNVEQVRLAAADEDVDVLAVGPVFATRSKQTPEPMVGLELVERARRLTTKPLVAIGGIDRSNVTQVLAAGADSVAVIGALGRTSPGAALAALVRAAGEGV